MEYILKHFCEEILSQENTNGILLINKEINMMNYSSEFDFLLIVVIDQPQLASVEQFDISNKSVEVYYFTINQISRILITGKNRALIDWLINGTVVFEKDEYISKLRKNIIDFPISERKYKMTVEFTKLIHRYTEGKKLFQSGHLLDAFNSILHSLHYLARLSVIEHGFYPEVTVWKQVKRFEPEIYKLYEEMVTGEESLEKRLELLLIANNFALASKTKIGASHLLEIMRQGKEPWSIEQLLNLDEIKEYKINLVALVEYLVNKGIVDIIKVPTEKENVFKRLFYIK
ncbi:nucleotidyltransferase-like protein [Bacillaceae bacterium IKA-2]|nr:nucleotidyltransferase-like protein [Bacillaceae bacterium IKA-2]